MKRFVKFESWYYVDAIPTYDIHTVEGATEEEIRKNAEEWAKDMRKKWPSGTVKFVSILSKEEALDVLKFQIAEEERDPKDISQEIIGMETKLYKECYEED